MSLTSISFLRPPRRRNDYKSLNWKNHWVLIFLLCPFFMPNEGMAQAHWDTNPKINECVEGKPGYRQYAAILWDIQGDWNEACLKTPAIFRGRFFNTPTRCVQKGPQMWGEFDVPDRSCGWAPPSAIYSHYTDVSYVIFEQGETILKLKNNADRTDFLKPPLISFGKEDNIRGWSWDGTKASYVMVKNGKSLLFTADFDGKEFSNTKWLQFTSSDNILGWSWDGITASYVAKVNGKPVLYIRSFDGDKFGEYEEMQLPGDTDDIRGWSWDGSRARYFAFDGNNIKLIDCAFNGSVFGPVGETDLTASGALGLRGWSMRTDFYMVFIANPLLQNDIPRLNDPSFQPIASNNSFVTQVNTLAQTYDIRGVVVNGNLTKNGYNYEFDYFKKAYEKLNVDVYTGLGPNEFSGTNARDIITDQIQKITNFQPMNFDATASGGSLAYSWDIGKVHFVQLNSSPDFERSVGSGSSSFSVTSALSWLANDLDLAVRSEKTVVLSYNECFDDGPGRMNEIYNDLLQKNVSTIIFAITPKLDTDLWSSEDTYNWKSTEGAGERRYYHYLQDLYDADVPAIFGIGKQIQNLTETQRRRPYYSYLRNNIEVPAMLSGSPIETSFLLVHFTDNKMKMYGVFKDNTLKLIKEIPFKGVNSYAPRKEVYSAGEPDLRSASGSDADPEIDGTPHTADDFVLSENYRLRRIEFWGSYFPAQTVTNSDNFKISIFDDKDGMPSQSAIREISIGDVKREKTATRISTGEVIYRYEARLNDFDLDKGKTYWLSIVNDTRADADDDWAWATSSPGSCALRSGETSLWEGGNSNFAFKFYGIKR